MHRVRLLLLNPSVFAICHSILKYSSDLYSTSALYNFTFPILFSSFLMNLVYNHFHTQSAAVDGMKVGRSIVALINKKSGQSVSRDVGKQLEQLAEGIENVTMKLSKEEAKVNQIVSYQAEAVYTGTFKTLEITANEHSEVAIPVAVAVRDAVAVGDAVAVSVEGSSALSKSSGVKSKTRSAFLKKLITKKTPSA